jgi:hypothetical protein
VWTHLAIELLISEEIIGEVELCTVDGGQNYFRLIALNLLGQPKITKLKHRDTLARQRKDMCFVVACIPVCAAASSVVDPIGS